MNIVYDHQIFGWQKYGGISRYFYELANRVVLAEGFSASIIAPLHVSSYLAGGAVPVRGIQVPKVRNSGRILSALNGLVSPPFIRRAMPDLLHETYYSRRTLAPKGCPKVLTVFDMTHEKFPGSFLSRDDTSEIKRTAVKRAERVICISENTRSDLIEILDIPIEKTAVVHLGFTLTADKATLPSPGKPFLLYVGPRGAYKNFGMLLEAYASSTALRIAFDLIAFGGGPFSQTERDDIRSRGLADSVTQKSGDDSVLAALYSEAAAFVYPSLYEGFGIPLLEAMSFDCPVVCSNTSSIPEVAGNAACYFEPEDADSIRTAIESVVFSSSLRDELVQLGRERIGHFSWNRTAMETMTIYEEMQ